MELNCNFAMFNAKEQINSKCNRSINYARTSALYRKDIGYCNPLLDASAAHACVCSLARTGGNSLSFMQFNSNSKMPKNNGIKASAKRSNTSFTSSHETANPQLTIDPLLAQILHHATMLSAITYDKKEYLKKFNGYYEHLERKMVEISSLAGDIMIQVGEAIGMDIADQGFDNTKLYR